MNRSLILEDFSVARDSAPSGASEVAPLVEPTEAEPLASYEAGYKNGWSDCAAAEAEERKSIGAHLATKLKEAELTYDAAREDIFNSLAPFFEDLVATLLPRLAAEALAPVVVSELLAMLENANDAHVEIHAAPGACERLQRLMDAEGFEAFTVRAEPAFAESQVSLRVNSERRDVDLSEVTEKIAEAVRSFQAQPQHVSISQGAA